MLLDTETPEEAAAVALPTTPGRAVEALAKLVKTDPALQLPAVKVEMEFKLTLMEITTTGVVAVVVPPTTKVETPAGPAVSAVAVVVLRLTTLLEEPVGVKL